MIKKKLEFQYSLFPPWGSPAPLRGLHTACCTPGVHLHPEPVGLDEARGCCLPLASTGPVLRARHHPVGFWALPRGAWLMLPWLRSSFLPLPTPRNSDSGCPATAPWGRPCHPPASAYCSCGTTVPPSLSPQMPVCSYFLKGICSNSSCPYSHVYVSRKAEVCAGFLKGYCPMGAKVRPCPGTVGWGVAQRWVSKAASPTDEDGASQLQREA